MNTPTTGEIRPKSAVFPRFNPTVPLTEAITNVMRVGSLLKALRHSTEPGGVISPLPHEDISAILEIIEGINATTFDLLDRASLELDTSSAESEVVKEEPDHG